MKTLKITTQTAQYYEDFNRDIYNYHLDKQLGRIVTIESMLKRQWEEEGEIDKRGLTQRQQENYNPMMAVFWDVNGGRYQRIPSVKAIEIANIMRLFVCTVQNKKIADELSEALYGTKKFRGFRAVLNRYDQVKQDYYEFKKKCYLYC